MCDRGWGMNPFQTVLRQRKSVEARGCDCQGMNGCADVMNKPGQRQFRRPGSAANGVTLLEDADGPPRAGHFNGGGEAVRSGAHDDRVEVHRRIVYAVPISPAATAIAETRPARWVVAQSWRLCSRACWSKRPCAP